MVSKGIGITTASESQERSHGQLHVYDGEGKGKSQAALGVVLRTIGLGICEKKQTRVLLLRFLKGPGRSYDEDAAIDALQQGFPHLIDQVWLPIPEEKILNLTWKILDKELLCLPLVHLSILQRQETTGAFLAALLESRYSKKLK